MAATPLNIQTITEVGMTPVAAVAGDNTNGNSVVNSGKQWIEATNTAGASGTFTVAFGYTVKGQTIPAKSFTVAATSTLKAGPFDPSVYGSTLIITPSAATITLNVFQLG